MKKITSILVLTSIFMVLNVYSQLLPPGVSWKRSDRLNDYPSTVTHMDGHTINEEAEDWWYDHKNSYVNGVINPVYFNGFITCGYSAPKNVEYAETNDGCLSAVMPAATTGIPWHWDYDLDYASMPDGIFNEPSFQTMGFYDEHGKLKWFKSYNNGWLIRVIQTSDGNYVAVGPTQSTREPDLSTELLYNYNATTNPNSYFGTATCGSNFSKVNVIKIDPNGDIIWNRIYGYNSIGEGADEEEDVPWDLVEYDIGGTPRIRVVGQHDPLAPGNKQAFMLDIESSDGSMNGFQLYAPAISGIHRKFFAIEKVTISPTEYLVVVGNEELGSGELRLEMLCEDAAGAFQWFQDYPSIGSGGTNSHAVDLCINSNNEILVPVMFNCNSCYWDGQDTYADASVYVFDISTGGMMYPSDQVHIS